MGEQIICMTHGYPQWYEPKRIETQLQILENAFPQLCTDEIMDIEDGRLPLGAEAWFVLPKWRHIAPTYNDAVDTVVAKLREVFRNKFLNYCGASPHGRNDLLQIKEKRRAWEYLERRQKGECVIIPAQFGILHCGIPQHRLDEVMAKGEFGLGAYEVGIMLLTHPERFHDSNNLWIECIGDICAECKPVHGLRHHPVYLMMSGEVRLTKESGVNKHYGAATGFLVP